MDKVRAGLIEEIESLRAERAAVLDKLQKTENMLAEARLECESRKAGNINLGNDIEELETKLNDERERADVLVAAVREYRLLGFELVGRGKVLDAAYAIQCARLEKQEEK